MKYVLSIVFIISLSQLFAQAPVTIHLSEKDGLPDIEFYGVVEDNKGFIWLAADKGLYRYDGKEFKNYNHPKKKGLSVFGLKFDTQGRLWCNNISGQYFYVENDSLRLFKDLKTYNKGGQLGTFLFYKNTLVVTCVNKIVSVDLSTKEVTDLLPKEVNVGQVISYTENDSLFVVTDKDLPVTKITQNGVEIQNLGFELKPQSKLQMFSSKRYKILNIRQSLVGLSKGNFYQRKNKFFKKASGVKLKNNTDAVGIYEIDNKLWIATSKGALVYEFEDGTYVFKTKYFKDKFVTGVLKDSNNNYWFTTHQNGVYIITNIAVKKYPTFFKDEMVTALAKIDTASILIGGSVGELKRINTVTNQVKDITLKTKQKVHKIIDLNNEQFISLNNVGGVLKSNNNFDLLANLGNAKGLSKISDKHIVYGGYSSARLLNLENKKINILKEKRTYATHFNKLTNEIYVGYIDELISYKRKNLKPKTIAFKGESIFALSITNTSDGVTWVATFKDGVLGIKNGKVIANYTVNNGLLSNQITLVKGDREKLWIVTDKGIQELDTKSNIFKNLTNQDGLVSFNISDLEVIGERVFLSSNKGLFEFDSNEVFKENKASKFTITKVLIDDVETDFTTNYDLSYDKNKIQFHFYTNGFLVEDNIEYRYRLDGKKWEVLDKGINQVTFNSLASGTYTFELVSIQTKTQKIAHQETIIIKIRAPFYKQFWFLTVASLMSLGVVSLYIIKIKKRQKEQLEKVRVQKQLASLKLTSLQAQLNPHFVFNALSSIQNLVLKDEKMKAYNYLTKFASLMRDTLRMSDKNFVYLHEELHQIIKYLELERLRFRNDFEFYIEDYSAIADVKIPTMLIQPFVENAIKHGLLHKKEGLKKIGISFKIEGSILICYVEDNGIGRIKAAQLKQEQDNTISFSTNAIKNRLKLLEKHYKNVGFTYENVRIGTKVAIRLPFK